MVAQLGAFPSKTVAYPVEHYHDKNRRRTGRIKNTPCRLCRSYSKGKMGGGIRSPKTVLNFYEV